MTARSPFDNCAGNKNMIVDIVYQPSYDNLGRITTAWTYQDDGGPTDVAKIQYQYDPNTNSITRQRFDQYTSPADPCNVYGYDRLRRLIQSDYGLDDTNEVFTLDKLGNRENVNVRGGSDVDYDVDALTNRYDEVGGNNLTYDAAGNLTTDRQGYTYQYDYENRITRILKSGPTTVAEFSYDALGRRVRKIDSVASVTRLYYYDKDWRAITEYDQNGNLKRRLAFGNYIDESLYALGSAPSYQYFYVHDHLYSTVALYSRLNGTILERYEYDAYGNPTIYTSAGTGTWWDGDETTGSASAKDNIYLFTGRQVDILDGGALKIQYNRNRYYDYYTGRWTTQDPLGTDPSGRRSDVFDVALQYLDGLNIYEYVQGNPIALVDAVGLAICCSPADAEESECFRTTALSTEVEWTIGGMRDYPFRWVGNNSIMRGLKVRAKRDCCEFVGPPMVLASDTNRMLWTGRTVSERGPTFFRRADGCECYQYVIVYKWSQGVQRPPILPGWAPWPMSYWMQTQISITICADGTGTAIPTNTSNRPRDYSAEVSGSCD